eukprot:m.32102 g.32102  ORF g.32102 m.32102 type:complete len:202 (+) comp42210_c0_seq1:82-687(+)
MGSGSSVLAQQQLADLLSSTHFTEKELKALLARFSEGGSGGPVLLSSIVDEPCLDHFPLIRKAICNAFRLPSRFKDRSRSLREPASIAQPRRAVSDLSPSLPFAQFVHLLSSLSSRGSYSEKSRLLFATYADPSSGMITRKDVVELFTDSLGGLLDHDQIQGLCAPFFAVDQSASSGLTFAHFERMVTVAEVQTVFSKDFV